MNNELILLCLAALSIGFFHTITGPDHYIPIIAIAKIKQWNLKQTLLFSFVCGIGHVLSSVIIGIIGISFMVLLKKLTYIESIRGDLAAWALAIFGILYFLWGIKQAYFPTHHHHHSPTQQLSFWAIFLIFVLGPCEPLIPLLMYPAAENSLGATVVVASIFMITTVTTMLAMTFIGYQGTQFIKLHSLERYSHALAGGSIALSAGAILFLGL